MVYFVVPDVPSLAGVTVPQTVADHTSPTQYLVVNADGSINETPTIGSTDGVVLLASAVRTTNFTGADQSNLSYKGIIVYITPGSFGASESAMVVTLQGKDPVSGTYYTILASAALTASTPVALTVYPGMASSANESANAVLPKTWNIQITASNWGTGGSTIGVACALLR